MRFHVATRTNEFGIRAALGARAWDVVRLVLYTTSLSAGAALATGLAMILAFDKVAQKWLTESSPDPVILGGLAVLLVAVAGLACWAPARRAASVDSSEALRYQ
ncbi:MAG: FtsX-like permease family protein [Bryobacteraceae bacterium]